MNVRPNPKTTLVILSLAFALILSGCNEPAADEADAAHAAHNHDAHGHEGHGADAHEGHDHAAQANDEADASPTSGAMRHYIRIQETLAADSLEGIRESAQELANALSATGEDEAAEAAQALGGTTEIEEVRRHFETVSTGVLAQLKDQGAEEGEYHEAHCPMAFDNRGASWIQADKTVTNPYYGSRMLRCGEIRETFTSDGI